MSTADRSFRLALATALVVTGVAPDVLAQNESPGCIAEAAQRLRENSTVMITTDAGERLRGFYQSQSADGPRVLAQSISGARRRDTVEFYVPLRDVSKIEYQRIFRIRSSWVSKGAGIGAAVGLLAALAGSSSSESDDVAIEGFGLMLAGALGGMIWGALISLFVPETVALECHQF